MMMHSVSQKEKGVIEREPIWLAFERDWYCLRYPEITEWMEEKRYKDCWKFYKDIGAAFGHSPNRYFDEVWYRNTYLDVQKGIASGQWKSGFEHYCKIGYKTYSPHFLFDEKTYRRLYPSLTDYFFESRGLKNGYEHYLLIGEKEGKKASPFVDTRLLREMAEHFPQCFSEEEGLLASWLVLPQEIADFAPISWYFDPKWYLERYPEVRSALAKGYYANALHHYLANETAAQFDPSPYFSEEYYLTHSPDIATAVQAGGFRNGYQHFVLFGCHEGRRPCEALDLVSYGKDLLVYSQCKSGAYDSAFARFIAEKKGYALLSAIEGAEISEEQSRFLFQKEAEIFLPFLARTPLDFSVYGVPHLSVIMVVHNQIALTLQALASLRANYEGAIEVILVDSGSSDETKIIERFVKGIKLRRYRINIGYLAGCNDALEHATAPNILYLNNDIRLYPETINHALKRLYSSPSIGAVAAKIVRTNMRLQEAGSIIWRNGSTYGYRREDSPNISEANFAREVDYGSAAFLLVRKGLLKRLGGYDERYYPAYFEDTDLCVRLRKLGARIIYEPLCVVEHLEYGSSGHMNANALMQKQWGVFTKTHQDFLRFQQPQHIRNALLGRERRRTERKRVLFVEDRIPLRKLGSGYVRSNDIIRSFVALDYHVTVFPVWLTQEPAFLLYPDFPEEVELILEHDVRSLPQFLEERAGYYDLIWVGRTHNMARLLPILNEASRFLPYCGAILDTEVVAAPRSLQQHALLGTDIVTTDLDILLKEELSSAHYCQQIIAVTQKDASLIERAGYHNVMVLGHAVEICKTPLTYEERKDILFVGAFHDDKAPNYDSIMWFSKEVLPFLDKLPQDVKVKIVGYVAPNVDLTPLASHPRIEIIGAVDDLEPLFNQHRIFIAPTRFAGGLPFKVHEAASFGLPMVVTDILKEQVGWKEGEEILSAPVSEPRVFAEQIQKLYMEKDLWKKIRQGVLRAVERDASPEHFVKQLSNIISVSLLH